MIVVSGIVSSSAAAGVGQQHMMKAVSDKVIGLAIYRVNIADFYVY